MIRKKKYKNIYDGPLVDWFDEIIKENYNDEQIRLREENIRLKELVTLIADAFTDEEYDSTKGIIRETIRSIDTITDESESAWNDYCLLSNFFEKYYGEHWNNYKKEY